MGFDKKRQKIHPLGGSIMRKRQILMSSLIILCIGTTHQSAEAGFLDRVRGEVQHRRDQVKKTAIETHPMYLQLVVALRGAKASKVITSRAECGRAVDDTNNGVRTVINISPMIRAIGAEAGHRACRQVF
ncbi:MAG: hypothetical protein U7127_16410 [Phormidium sp.]